jgi:hypothetical protein
MHHTQTEESRQAAYLCANVLNTGQGTNVGECIVATNTTPRRTRPHPYLPINHAGSFSSLNHTHTHTLSLTNLPTHISFLQSLLKMSSMGGAPLSWYIFPQWPRRQCVRGTALRNISCAQPLDTPAHPTSSARTSSSSGHNPKQMDPAMRVVVCSPQAYLVDRTQHLGSLSHSIPNNTL